ncbi:Vps36-domain-containing protein [Venturia nashicola]|uniref:Vacuolar protein-sorting-associated protein 36 n=1 Tax=Venturia nashicola TaxID=86259 RepID=A0A4Z1PJJ1_9PEZI|nr:Vps36-domain-containing protein [Venturia nashicola]TLD36229.1 Vps36-domain-containing protein [Venturia nashicola]
MLLRQIDLNTASQPLYLPDETVLFIQDAVGLYEGKYKIPQYQNGRAYLTSHRACYVGNDEDARRFAVAVDLKDVDRPELYAGFLKSSPKITLYSKASKQSPLSIRNSPYSASPALNRQNSPSRQVAPAPVMNANVTWICPICTFANPVPSNFDPATANTHTNIPPCLSCGIKPPTIHVVKAALTAMSKRSSYSESVVPSRETRAETFSCPRCTFENYSELLICEVCGASLVTADKRLSLDRAGIGRPESPGPMLKNLDLNDDQIESVKFSFRDGGEKIFFERLKGALVQRKWLLQSAPPIPHPKSASNGASAAGSEIESSNTSVGIARLEQRGQQLRQNNQMIIGNAFEDLAALMTSAKEVIALAERFRGQASRANGTSSETNAIISQSASALGLTATKDTLGSDTLYISELSRNLAEFLTDDSRNLLKREGGIMSLVDLWAVFNRARGGVELISPAEFTKAAEMWDKLKLPVRLRRFKSGLLAVQGRDRTDEKTIASLLAWLKNLHHDPPEKEVAWDWQIFGRGVTAQETAQEFGWSVGVATEELEMAEEKGALCREQGLDGLRFWENWLVKIPQMPDDFTT